MKTVKIHESNKRSIAKAVTYRFYQSFLISPFIAFALTQDLMLGIKFGILEIIVKIPTYYLFERIWSAVRHGYKGG